MRISNKTQIIGKVNVPGVWPGNGEISVCNHLYSVIGYNNIGSEFSNHLNVSSLSKFSFHYFLGQ